MGPDQVTERDEIGIDELLEAKSVEAGLIGGSRASEGARLPVGGFAGICSLQTSPAS